MVVVAAVCVCVFLCLQRHRVCCDAAISAEIDLKIFMALLKLGVEIIIDQTHAR